MKSIQLALLTGLIACGLACGYSSKPAPAVAGTMPAIAQLAPDNTTSLGPSFTLTVNGSNFNSDAVVNWNATAQTTAFVSATQLTATIPGSAIQATGTVPITVTNPGKTGTGLYGGGGTLPETSAAVTFTIN